MLHKVRGASGALQQTGSHTAQVEAELHRAVLAVCLQAQSSAGMQSSAPGSSSRDTAAFWPRPWKPAGRFCVQPEGLRACLILQDLPPASSPAWAAAARGSCTLGSSPSPSLLCSGFCSFPARSFNSQPPSFVQWRLCKARAALRGQLTFSLLARPLSLSSRINSSRQRGQCPRERRTRVRGLRGLVLQEGAAGGAEQNHPGAFPQLYTRSAPGLVQGLGAFALSSLCWKLLWPGLREHRAPFYSCELCGLHYLPAAQ